MNNSHKYYFFRHREGLIPKFEITALRGNLKIIDLEAHFYTADYINYLHNRKEYPREEVCGTTDRMWYSPEIWMPHGKINEGKLLDLGDLRIKDMDEAGLDVQVLSLSAPGCEQFDPREGTALARDTNNELSLAIKKYPQRFIGLAALAPQDPGESAKELERSVKELGMKGAKINSNIRGEYLDDQKYWPIFDEVTNNGEPGITMNQWP